MEFQDCEAFLAVIFFTKTLKHLFFDIVGWMCNTQLNLLPAKFLLPSLFWSFSWHMRIRGLSYLKKRKIIHIRGLAYNFNLLCAYWFRNNKDDRIWNLAQWNTSLSHLIFLYPFSSWVPFHVNFCDPPKKQVQGVWKEGSWVGFWNFGILKKHTFLPL